MAVHGDDDVYANDDGDDNGDDGDDDGDGGDDSILGRDLSFVNLSSLSFCIFFSFLRFVFQFHQGPSSLGHPSILLTFLIKIIILYDFKIITLNFPKY